MAKTEAETYRELGIELGPELEADFAEQGTPDNMPPMPAMSRKEQIEARRNSPEAVTSDLAKQLDELDTAAVDAVSPQSGEQQPSQTGESEEDDLSWLDLPEDLGLQAQKDVPEIPNTPEAKKFAEDFKQFLGFDIEELRGGVAAFKEMQTEITRVRQEKVAAKALKELQATWGVDGQEFDGRLRQITERHKKYEKTNPALYQQLDNIEGAKLLWAKIEQEGKATKPSVPRFDRAGSSTPPTGSSDKKTLTWAQIESLSDAEYKRLQPKIDKLMLEGRIK